MQVRRGTASSWTSTNPTLAAGELGFETDTGKFKIGTGSSTWTGLAYATGLNAITYLYNATAAQTTFSGADANGLTLAYTVGTEQVFLNGALQVRGSDYTATNGTSIVLTSGALASDVLNVIAYGATTITDTYTQAQADARFVQQSTNFFAGKNKIINGDFNINQRAFTSVTASAYTFDRWRASVAGDGTATFTSQTFTPGAAPIAGYESTNFLQIATTGQTLTSTQTNISQRIESVRILAGQTATVSFWSKATSGTPKIAVELAQIFGNGGSPSATVNTYLGQATLSTSWTRYSFSISVPSISGKTIGTDVNTSYLSLNLFTSAGSDLNSRTGSLGIQTATIQFWGVQVENGSTATAFQTATGTIQGELAACMRYYERFTSDAVFGLLGTGKGYSTGVLQIILPFKTTKRALPSGIDTSAMATFYFEQGGTGGNTPTTVSINAFPTNLNYGYVDVTKSGSFTIGTFYTLQGNNTASAFIGFTSEL
jgi:hypothetical protein